MEWLCALLTIGIIIAGTVALARVIASQASGRSKEPPMRRSRTRSEARFLLGDEPVEIAGRVCPNPIFYVVRDGSQRTPPSWIDLELPVARHTPPKPPSLPYWPSYAEMSPAHRAAYLDWLAGGRTDPDMPTGYVFVFFYGLERRLITGHDAAAIRKELYRLLPLYGESGSFHGYTTRLLTFTAMRDLDELREGGLPEALPMFDAYGRVHTESLRAWLTWYGRRERPLPWRLAMAVAMHDERSPKSVVLERTREEFETLFQERYADQFGAGFTLEYLGRRSKVQYRPASSVLGRELQQTGQGDLLKVSMNDPLSRARQFDPLVDLFTECVDELRSYSRAVGKAVGDELTVDAWEKLPPDLQAEIPHPNAGRWMALLQTHLGDDGWAHVPAGELAEVCDITSKKRLSRSECRSVAATAAAMGFAVEPDPRIMPQSWRGDDRVVLLQLDDPDRHLAADSTYAAVAVVLYMSVYVASADGEVDSDEIEVIRDHLLEAFHLEHAGRRRMDAACAALAEAKLDMRGVARLIEDHLSEAHRERVAALLVDVALADGALERDEETYLKRAYKALDLDPAVGLERAREGLARRRPELAEPVSVRDATPDEGAMPIPPKPEEASGPTPRDADTDAPERVELDPDRLAKTLRETRAVAETLGAVFAQEGDPDQGDATPAPEPAPPLPTAADEDLLAELAPRYRPLLEDLLRQPEWQPDEVDALADRHGVMRNGAIAAINTWADEHLGDFLIEGPAPYTIYRDLYDDREAP